MTNCNCCDEKPEVDQGNKSILDNYLVYPNSDSIKSASFNATKVEEIRKVVQEELTRLFKGV